ncbi:MAG TPA: N-acetylmuramoyl-L-alanine amidase [Abditibacteriaceae bacterium]|jgi:N-acetylmuramoyl-L-alanine amidase
MKFPKPLSRSLIGAAILFGFSPLAHAQRPFVVGIDPGHPSEVSAGSNANGLSENRLNWQVFVRLANRLNKRKITWITTKTRINQKVTNRQRAERANAVNADLMIRLHCDVGSGRGFGWYYPDRSARHGGVTGPSRAVQLRSREAAQTLNTAMIPILRGHLQPNPIKTDAATFVGGKNGGALIGSIHSRVPTALIEMCFINNRRDAQFINSVQGQEKMAQALEAGILAWKRKIGK